MEPNVAAATTSELESGTVEEEAVEEAAQEVTLPEGHYKITTGGTVRVGGAKGEERKVTYVVDLGYDLVDAGEKFSQGKVYDSYISGARVKAGGFARAQIEQGANVETLQAFMEDTWSIAHKTGAIVDPIAAGRDAIGRLTDDDLAALLAERGIEI